MTNVMVVHHESKTNITFEEVEERLAKRLVEERSDYEYKSEWDKKQKTVLIEKALPLSTKKIVKED